MTHAPTTIFTPATCATTMRAAAKRYDQDGRATADRAHALALPASATPDVHVASSGTSDPTPDQAMQRPPGYAQYVDRWAKVTASLDGLVGAPLPRNLRSVASIIEKSPRRFQQTTINRLGNLCDELIIVINACMPFDPDKARKTLHDKARLTNAASVCFACHSPGETKSGLCPEDYELQRYHLARGRHDFADLPSFARYVEDRIRLPGLELGAGGGWWPGGQRSPGWRVCGRWRVGCWARAAAAWALVRLRWQPLPPLDRSVQRVARFSMRWSSRCPMWSHSRSLPLGSCSPQSTHRQLSRSWHACLRAGQSAGSWRPVPQVTGW